MASANEGAEDDWETRFESGDVVLLDQPTRAAPPETPATTTACTTNAQISSFDDIVSRPAAPERSEALETSVGYGMCVRRGRTPAGDDDGCGASLSGTSPPETRSAAPALAELDREAPVELINRREEGELTRRREQNRTERAERRKELDAVWDQPSN